MATNIHLLERYRAIKLMRHFKAYIQRAEERNRRSRFVGAATRC